MRPDRPPADVGGRFSIAGLSFGAKEGSYGYSGDFNGEERAMRDQARKFDRTVWEGVLLGAAIGTVAGVVGGGDAEDAVGGAIVGSALGAIVGIYVANKQRQFASSEDQLNAMVADVEAANRETMGLIDSARIIVDEDRRRLDALRTSYEQGRVTEAAVREARGRAWANRDVLEGAVRGAKDQQMLFQGSKKSFATTNPAVSVGSFDRALNAYAHSISQLDGIVGEMAGA